MSEPARPRLEDIGEILRFAFGLLSDAEDLDTLLATLQVASGLTPSGVVITESERAATRFVLDALTDALVAQLRSDLESH